MAKSDRFVTKSVQYTDFASKKYDFANDVSDFAKKQLAKSDKNRNSPCHEQGM